MTNVLSLSFYRLFSLHIKCLKVRIVVVRLMSSHLNLNFLLSGRRFTLGVYVSGKIHTVVVFNRHTSEVDTTTSYRQGPTNRSRKWKGTIKEKR